MYDTVDKIGNVVTLGGTLILAALLLWPTAAAGGGAAASGTLSNIETTNKSKAVAFFQAATTNLLAAEERAGITHHVALSIVGVDRVGWGYYAGKLRQEELALTGAIPATVLRATQFHEFAAQMLGRGGPFAIAPRMLCQPVAAREVAAALVEIARNAPLGQAPELAGPQQLQMADMVRHDLFGLSFTDIATTVGRTPPPCVSSRPGPEPM